MTNNQEVGIFVGVGDLFPGLIPSEEALRSLLAQLSRDDTIFMCARLNLVISDPDCDHLGRQRRAVAMLCTPEEVSHLNMFVRQHGVHSPISVFFRGQLLELVRWSARYCPDLPEDGDTFKDPAVRQRFLQAALIASAIWAQRHYTTNFTLDGGLDVARRRNLGAIRGAIEESSTAPDLTTSFGRGWKLFTKYFPGRYPTFERDFHEAAGLSLEEYYVSLTAVLVNFVLPFLKDANKSPVFTFASGAATPYAEVFPRYLLLESQTADELAASLWTQERFPDSGFRSLRERPLFRTADGRMIVLDLLFFGARASVGALFHLLKLQSTKANEVFGAFGLAVEDYAAAILRRMYPTGEQLGYNIRGVAPSGKTLEVDASLGRHEEVFLFETKAAWLREDARTGDPQTYLDEIRRKYGVVADSESGERAKGVAQLARIVEAISEGWQGPDAEFAQASTLKPILLVHDTYLGVAVHGHFLAQEFSRLISGREIVEEIRKGGKRVVPLVIMTLADLEILEESVACAEFDLRELVEEYSSRVTDRVQSLHNFMAASKFRERLRRNKRLAETTLQLLRQTGRLLFPEVPPPEEDTPD